MKISPAREAATLLLLRDTPAGLEVFMQVRHPRIGFAAGALVFPGGAVDEADLRPELAPWVDGLTQLSASERGSRIAAVREVFEECTVLLARDENGLIEPQRAAHLYAKHQKAIREEEWDLLEMLEEESLCLACDQLIPFGHWITPESQPNRFDTRFYITKIPDGHQATHDGVESVESLWVTPEQICAEADAGKWHLMFPTRMTIERLGQCEQVDETLALAKHTPIVPVLPKTVETEAGCVLSIPPEAGYSASRVLMDRDGIFHPLKQ